MTIKFNGRDLVAHFKEDPDNQAVRQYRIEYACKNATITHYVKAEDNQGNDATGLRLYRDVLLYSENEAAGLTRSPEVTFYSQDANLQWSYGAVIEAQNPIPVFSAAPAIAPTLTGVEVTVIAPFDQDFEGYICWVSTSKDMPLDDTTERYRGKANSFTIALPSDDLLFMRVSAYDAFGLDTFGAWSVQEIRRANLVDAIKDSGALDDFGGIDLYPIIDKINGVAELGERNLTANDRAAKAYSDQAMGYVDSLRADVLADGTDQQTAINNLTTTTGNLQTAIDNEKTVRSNADQANATAISVVGTKADNNAAALLDEKNSTTTRFDAVATRLQELQASTDSNSAGISTEQKARTDAISAETTARTQQISNLNGSLSASIKSEETTRTNQVGSLTTTVNQLNASLANTTSRVTNAESAIVNGDNANASRINTVQSSLDQTNSSLAIVQQTANTSSNRLGSVEAQYGFSVQAGSTIVGMKALASSAGTSQIVFQAEAIAFRNPGNGGADQLMEFANGQMRVRNAVIGNANIIGANIQDLTVGTNHIAINAVTVTHVASIGQTFYGNNGFQQVIAFTFYCPQECDLIPIWFAGQGFPGGDKVWEGHLYVDGNDLASAGGAKTADTFTLAGGIHVGAGNHTVSVNWKGENGNVRLTQGHIICLEARR